MPGEFRSVPLVDIVGLWSGDIAVRRAVAQAMGQAAREVGFLYITGHGLPDDLIADLRRAGEAFFAQPLPAKMESYIGRSSNHSGYVPEGEEVFEAGKVDRKEAYDVGFDCPDGAADEPMVGPNLWPPMAGFKDRAQAYYDAVSGLARRLFRGFALALDLPEDHFDPHLTRPPSQLRLVRYPFDAEAHDQEGIGAHTDYEFFTILFTSAPGLEVKNGAGEWIDAPPVPGALVVNIGDMLEVWTNGVFVATAHRVRKVAEERYAFPFFATCDFKTVVAPHARFVGPDRPARFGSVVSGEHLFEQTRRTFRYLGGPAAA
jgi:isopenicillin N synthase-like dioxygenase